MNKPNKAAIYCRASADPGAFEPENADSLAYQIGGAMAFILDNRLTFSGLYIDEDGYSALEALIRDSMAGTIDSVIVRDLDVLATDDAILNRLEAVPVVFIGADDLDSTRENLWVETLQYKLEEAHHTDDHREAISKSVKDAVTAKKAEGRLTGRPPYGYQKAGENYIADPDTSVVLKQIFALAKDGSRPAEIRRYLNENGIPTPSGGVSWSIAQIQNILKNAVYCGGDNTEVLVDKVDFDQIQMMTTRKKASAEDKEPDLFPMAVCGFCGKKLSFKRSRGIYLCDRHTGEYPTEEPLEDTPKISVEELKRMVVKQYNEQLIQMQYFEEKTVLLPDLKMEERSDKKIELGERILGIALGTPDYLSKVRNACEGYEGLWNDWIESLQQLRDAYHKGLIQDRLSQLWRPMHEYNPQIGMRAIESIKLGKDGRVETLFKAADVFS